MSTTLQHGPHRPRPRRAEYVTMKSPFWLPLLLALFSFSAWADAPGNGLYGISETGRAVKTLGGKEIHLGEKLGDAISKAVVRSVSNDNEQYYLSLEKAGAFSKEYDSVAFCADGYCVQFHSGGNSNNETFTMGEQFTSPAAAESFASFFGVTPLKRAHPGYALAARFVPSKESFSTDEPLPVALEIKNAGNVPVTFQVGGKDRGERNNQFGFTAYDGVQAVPDTGSPVHFGGLSVNQTLKPGETFRKDVDLRKWFTFKKPGTYKITGTYDLSFFDPTFKDWFVIWEDYAADAFYVTVK
jgi:hypothetical protein